MTVETILASIPEFETSVGPRAVPLGMTSTRVPPRRPRVAWAAGLLALMAGGLLWGASRPAEESWQVAVDGPTYTVSVQGEMVGLEFRDGARTFVVQGGSQ